MTRPGWSVHDHVPGVPTHVWPNDDAVEHDTETTDPTCVCGPKVELVTTDAGDHWMILHHSLDGREQHEPKPS